MPRYIALLRAVNVGGRNVRMEELREHFENLDFNEVESFIASGNIIFKSLSENEAKLREKIEAHLEKELGYHVSTFLRNARQIAAVADHPPFPTPMMDEAEAVVIGFLQEPLTPEQEQTLQSMRTDIDEFHTFGREIYWLCRKKQSESTFSNSAFERKVGVEATFRTMSTVRKLSAKYGRR
jgi:uncharacterized protein (DUF1697 family)